MWVGNLFIGRTTGSPGKERIRFMNEHVLIIKFKSNNKKKNKKRKI